MESTTGGTRAAAATTDARPSTGAAEPPAESSRREVSAGAHFAALDGYRALAAFMVVSTHIAFSTGAVTGSSLGHVLARFDFGVPLFFLMSGFLLYRPWARAALEGRARPDLRRYAIRRAARILPLYWLVVCATLLVVPEIRPVSSTVWWQHLLAVQIYTGPGAVEGLTQTWSLCTEIAFYIALPVIGAVALGRRGRAPRDPWRRQMRILGALVTVAVVFNLAKFNNWGLPGNAGYWLPAYLDWFAAGMALALVEVRSHQPDRPALVRWVVALGREQTATIVTGVAVFLVSTTPVAGAYDFNLTAPWESMIKHWLYLGAAALLLIPGIFGGDRGVRSVMSSSWPHRAGLISYGIFLWHLLLIRLIAPALGIAYFTGRGWLLALVVFPATIAVASVTYLLVERPAQRWAHRR